MLLVTVIRNAVTLTARFTSPSGDAVTPAAVRFRLAPRAGGPEVSLTATAYDGVASATYEPTIAGVWDVRVESDNPTSAFEDEIRIQPSAFPAPA